ncbi:hypothetical protein GE191_23555 [Serratia fonticola]|uniref:hypothetical protein n=1 Tax=Serratia fonticola TaxID=47917 RepID=UPI0013776F00|nr:hypothetical protein [Serratia fonticola]NBJ36633.1 hypothetical protein [Serratia fonticola]
MKIVSVGDGYVVCDSSGDWKEGKFFSKQLVELALETLSDADLSQLHLTTLSDGRSVITQDDYERYVSAYKTIEG